ncbi:MAG: DNA cytosine methyltransferase, partial [Planctomycetes bacterium]|nr:DNA cytosine methyltransferase [Planctomycetota bacterium]
MASGLFEEIDVDNFAGGGGVGMGFELATGKAFDIAINHDEAAIAMHRANHPHTRHLCESVW